MRRKCTHVLCDASSALLLFKAGIIEALFDAVCLVFPRTVYTELTSHLRPGAEQFTVWYARQFFSVVDVSEEEKFQIPLHGGERELVLLYLEGRGKFLILDDKKAATYCRRHTIPYMNALLVPRLLLLQEFIDAHECETAEKLLLQCGRYAAWVVTYAQNCTDKELERFL